MDFWGCREGIRGKGKVKKREEETDLLRKFLFFGQPQPKKTKQKETKNSRHHWGIISSFFKTQIRSWWIIINEMLLSATGIKICGAS